MLSLQFLRFVRFFLFSCFKNFETFFHFFCNSLVFPFFSFPYFSFFHWFVFRFLFFSFFFHFFSFFHFFIFRFFTFFSFLLLSWGLRQNIAFSYKSLSKARFWEREERKKKEERADRNRSPSHNRTNRNFLSFACVENPSLRSFVCSLGQRLLSLCIFGNGRASMPITFDLLPTFFSCQAVNPPSFIPHLQNVVPMLLIMVQQLKFT